MTRKPARKTIGTEVGEDWGGQRQDHCSHECMATEVAHMALGQSTFQRGWKGGT